MPDETPPEDPLEDPPERLDRLFDELEELEDAVETPEARQQVREVMRAAMHVSRPPGAFGNVVKGFGREDLAEALLGSVLFGIPMFVEGGTQEVGEYLAGHPLSFVGTLCFAVGMVVGILYVADIQDVRVSNPILGVVPRRLVGVVGVSFLTALLLMTGWGRVDWSTPGLAIADVVVAFVPMSIGAALGDILPGT
ncbi:DUF2391 family protein [Halopelagius longus]|uniref:DUF2391 family protein n=1 Tax=Halopelagius longus TaxID=1236180 RepID=A0A1H1DT27_9EURY|nr:DUF2391 family protein [Halopelagius longus]RDI71451.1 DUF2391 family protein [Halopelagius longus]SDQ79388.1 Putative integral membrane protein [Halopelagius longus]